MIHVVGHQQPRLIWSREQVTLNSTALSCTTHKECLRLTLESGSCAKHASRIASDT